MGNPKIGDGVGVWSYYMWPPSLTKSVEAPNPRTRPDIAGIITRRYSGILEPPMSTRQSCMRGPGALTASCHSGSYIHTDRQTYIHTYILHGMIPLRYWSP